MKGKTFEVALEALENIVQELETGDLPLEHALKKFGEGVRLSKYCGRKLDETEKKITILLDGQNGELAEKPFDPLFDPEDDSEIGRTAGHDL